MKILIAPLILDPNRDASYHLTKALVEVFTDKEITCSVSADEENHFKHVSLYPCAEPEEPSFVLNAEERVHEEWLYNNGILQKKYLMKDVQMLENAISLFKPDLIISIDRPAAVMVSNMHNIACWEFVYPAMYRNTIFPAKCMHGLNQALEECGLDQELDLQGLYAKVDRRIGFGPMEIAPYLAENHVTRFGCMSLFPKKQLRTNRVCIFLDTVNEKPKKLQRIIETAFLGAPYYVYICIPGIPAYQDNNLHYISLPDPNLINGASALIHDGNDFYFNQAILLGVPQMIIADHSYQRNFNALAAARNKFGSYIFEENLDMASLYEGYRDLLSDDSFYENTQTMREKTRQLGDLHQLVDMMYIDLIDHT